MSTSSLRRFAIALATAALFPLGAALADAGERAGPRRHTVTIEGNVFHPDDLAIERGDTVVWVNRDFYPHTATDTEGSFDSGTIPADGSWERTFETAGKLSYYCRLHPVMKATLRVR